MENPSAEIDLQMLLAKIGEDTIIKQMMAQDIQRLMQENQSLKERVGELEQAQSEPEESR